MPELQGNVRCENGDDLAFFAENSLEYGDSNRLDVWLFFYECRYVGMSRQSLKHVLGP